MGREAGVEAAGLIVFENSNITSGQSMWDDFVALSEEGIPCEVGLAFYYTLDNRNISPELYEETKDDYPALYIQTLSYDGKLFTLSWTEGEEDYTFRYKYLKRFDDKSPPFSARFSERIWYALVNDKEVTGKQIEKGMFSSQYGDHIDFMTVYSKYVYK